MGGAGTKSGGSERKRDRRFRRVAFWPRSRRSEANGTRAKAKPAGVVKLLADLATGCGRDAGLRY
jgi:hypothetical protein